MSHVNQLCDVTYNTVKLRYGVIKSYDVLFTIIIHGHVTNYTIVTMNNES